MELKNIKLVIWDLDDTFWRGTISEGEITYIDENVRLVTKLTDIGIVNSICSKNDFAVVHNQLTESGLWDYFVFPMVDWSSKGNRVKSIIDMMNLRYVNVLFVDDNIQNLEEAKYFCPGLMTAHPDELEPLYIAAERAESKDLDHKRLKQYQLLEQKEASKNEYESSDAFLMSCNICVKISTDCEKQIDRLHELIMRSNQLNYTKNRQTKEELIKLLNTDNVDCGYVSVKDKFGDYGIVGFYAVQHGTAIHYVFSCRILGMQVEQYVYQYLNCPKIDVVGDVASELSADFIPPWINNRIMINRKTKTVGHTRILLKGPCDMSAMHTFLNSCGNIATEFSYTNDHGVLIEGHNHTAQIVTALLASEQEKRDIANDLPFFDQQMLNTALTHEKFDVVVLSMLTDGNLGIYRQRKSGKEIALCEKYYSLVEPGNVEKYICGEVATLGAKFTGKMLADFAEKYEFIENSDWTHTINNLDIIWKYIGKEVKLVLLLGSEKEFKKQKQKESYVNRHVEHSMMNRAIRIWAAGKENVTLLPYDKYIRSDADFFDTLNHFVKKVYYELANDLVVIFNQCGLSEVSVKSKRVLYMQTIRQRLRAIKTFVKKMW
ncbi:MAG: hypothetical protein IJO31_08465 [Oscillospiraceae bacterium]|nr:hypothetical protein [Oscillospiraceae bacterium]